MSRLILFDAVGTIIEPRPDVVTAYHNAGLKFGSRHSRDEVAARFKQARQEQFFVGVDANTTPANSLPSNDEMEEAMWRSLVENVFDDVDEIDALFDELWTHFSEAANWSTFDDVGPCWNRLKQIGFQIGIASNFDSRLNSIVDQDEVLSQADYVFCSAEIGYRKPDPQFYRRLLERLPQESSPLEMVMVGDDLQNDWAAPTQLGWQAFQIDRTANLNEQRGKADHVIGSLDELLDRV